MLAKKGVVAGSFKLKSLQPAASLHLRMATPGTPRHAHGTVVQVTHDVVEERCVLYSYDDWHVAGIEVYWVKGCYEVRVTYKAPPESEGDTEGRVWYESPVWYKPGYRWKPCGIRVDLDDPSGYWIQWWQRPAPDAPSLSAAFQSMVSAAERSPGSSTRFAIAALPVPSTDDEASSTTSGRRSRSRSRRRAVRRAERALRQAKAQCRHRP